MTRSCGVNAAGNSAVGGNLNQSNRSPGRHRPTTRRAQRQPTSVWRNFTGVAGSEAVG